MDNFLNPLQLFPACIFRARIRVCINTILLVLLFSGTFIVFEPEKDFHISFIDRQRQKQLPIKRNRHDKTRKTIRHTTLCQIADAL